MDIPTKKFTEHQHYEKNDIVEVGALATDPSVVLIGNMYDGMNNGPLSGTAFRIDGENDLDISFLLDKEENSTTLDRARGAVIFRDDQYPNTTSRWTCLDTYYRIYTSEWQSDRSHMGRGGE